MIRDPASIGAGLAPARDARPIPAGERIHIIGAAGAASKRGDGATIAMPTQSESP